ncbi:MAG TPA: transcription antitermination factor NusB [Cytophagales bacterium]|nr:transcription antitermination factor NusB [Cytophagales bacterium]
MLNRRTLRVKIMQTLFAYDQCIEANNTLAQDLINERFAPDLNSMEVQDKALLKEKRKEALEKYIQRFEAKQVKESEDPLINKVVDEALKLYETSSKKDFNFLRKNLVVEVEKINNRYFEVLGLLLAFVEAAKTDKKENHAHFINNNFLNALKNDASLQSLLLKSNATWEHDRLLVQGWFRDVIKSDKVYSDYIKETAVDDVSQKNVIKHIIRKLILGDTVINDHFMEINIRWAEDHDIVKSLADKTLKSFDVVKGTFQLQKLSMDWEDDLLFMNTLFEKTTQIEQANKDLIANNTKNWEVDRLPLTDRIILEMAITELINFPAIPVKVSINEYIELTKHYSTPKSAKFVNGILDVIAKELVASGAVRKSGRGLIDNK